MTDKQPCILIAEDFEDNRIALKLMLKLAGFNVLEAEDGPQAVDVVRREKPDLVLMDISLPVLDGLQATRALRAEAEFAQLPIIIVSAYDDQINRDQAQAAGGTAYLSKPIEFDQLRTLIAQHLANRQT
jgi:two-component system, cell cycle response regulator DivK